MPLSTYIQPLVSSDVKIAIVGDFPKKGADKSFTESFFWNLKANLKASGINIDTCLLCSTLDYYPGFVATGHDFDWEDPKAKTAVETLEVQLLDYQPDVIIVLGAFSLRYFKPGCDPMEKERGAPFKWKGFTCVASFHPRDLFAQAHQAVLVQADMTKAARFAKDGWHPPAFNINYLPTFQEAMTLMQKFIDAKAYLATDIETYFDKIVGTKDLTCIGFAYTKKDALVIPYIGKNGQGRYWTKDEEILIRRRVNEVLETCRHVGHNAVHFDHQALIRREGMVSNFVDDTMFGIWSLYPELLKSLGFCSSIYTDLPYWKDELAKSRSGQLPRWKEFEYNGRDCIVTMQVALAIGAEFKEKDPAIRDHYKFNIRVSRAYEYMALQGCHIDTDKLFERVTKVGLEVKEGQARLNERVGHDINVNSYQQVRAHVYGTLGLPEQKTFKKNKDGSREENVTSDYLTMLYLGRLYPQFPELLEIGQLRKKRKKLSFLESLAYDPRDNRCQWNYNVVGTETGRSSGYKPLNLLGIQPQNADREERALFIPPEGYWWCKADLEGADSVTVAACLQSLGEPRLLRDIQAKIKPAQTLALALMLGDKVMSWSAEEIQKELHLLKTPEGKKMYRVAKAVNHGSAYMLSPKGMHTNIFKQSDGDLFIPVNECDASQKLLFKRYNYELYHSQLRKIMNSRPLLRCANGQERYFFGRNDNATLRKMLAYMPQAHTAYVTNRCIERMYYNRENRDGRSLRVKLGNQVHDETDFYIKKGDEDFASELFHSSCHVPLEIWGVPFEIEFEAEYGPHWGEQTITL